jgi:integral membrane sensor domain MASE1
MPVPTHDVCWFYNLRPVIHDLIHLDTAYFIYIGFSYGSMAMPASLMSAWLCRYLNPAFLKPVDP